MARTRWPPGPVNPGLLPGQADQTGSAGGCQNLGPGRQIVIKTARAAPADSEVRPGPRPPTLRSHQVKTREAGPEALPTSSLPTRRHRSMTGFTMASDAERPFLGGRSGALGTAPPMRVLRRAGSRGWPGPGRIAGGQGRAGQAAGRCLPAARPDAELSCAGCGLVPPGCPGPVQEDRLNGGEDRGGSGDERDCQPGMPPVTMVCTGIVLRVPRGGHRETAPLGDMQGAHRGRRGGGR
jgi:hypothetical protein